MWERVGMIICAIMETRLPRPELKELFDEHLEAQRKMIGEHVIEFTPEKIKQLKQAIKKAEAVPVDTFQFEGNEVLVSYAKYLVEFLENRVGTV